MRSANGCGCPNVPGGRPWADWQQDLGLRCWSSWEGVGWWWRRGGTGGNSLREGGAGLRHRFHARASRPQETRTGNRGQLKGGDVASQAEEVCRSRIS